VAEATVTKTCGVKGRVTIKYNGRLQTFMLDKGESIVVK
jgi:hypothetical protein